MRISDRESAASVNKHPDIDGGSGFLDAAALVLAGGRGRRAGGNKLFLSFDGHYLVEGVLANLPALFRQVLVSCRDEDAAPFRNIFGGLFAGHDLRIVTDRVEGVGPLEGISVGLHASRYPWVFVFGCDMPMIQEAVVRFMWSRRSREVDAVIARLGGFIEPLHAFYNKRCVTAVDEAISRSEHKISSFLPAISPQIVKEEDMEHIPGFRRSFLNINTTVDIKRWQEGISGRY